MTKARSAEYAEKIRMSLQAKVCACTTPCACVKADFHVANPTPSERHAVVKAAMNTNLDRLDNEGYFDTAAPAEPSFQIDGSPVATCAAPSAAASKPVVAIPMFNAKREPATPTINVTAPSEPLQATIDWLHRTITQFDATPRDIANGLAARANGSSYDAMCLLDKVHYQLGQAMLGRALGHHQRAVLIHLIVQVSEELIPHVGASVPTEPEPVHSGGLMQTTVSIKAAPVATATQQQAQPEVITLDSDSDDYLGDAYQSWTPTKQVGYSLDCKLEPKLIATVSKHCHEVQRQNKPPGPAARKSMEALMDAFSGKKGQVACFLTALQSKDAPGSADHVRQVSKCLQLAPDRELVAEPGAAPSSNWAELARLYAKTLKQGASEHQAKTQCAAGEEHAMLSSWHLRVATSAAASARGFNSKQHRAETLAYMNTQQQMDYEHKVKLAVCAQMVPGARSPKNPGPAMKLGCVWQSTDKATFRDDILCYETGTTYELEAKFLEGSLKGDEASVAAYEVLTVVAALIDRLVVLATLIGRRTRWWLVPAGAC